METKEAESGYPYARVGLFRIDVRYRSPIDLKDGDAVVPNWGDYGGMNDRLFYGARQHAKVWATGRFGQVDSYLPAHKNRLHSETFMKWLMRDIQPAKTPICFHLVRATGKILTWECGDF